MEQNFQTIREKYIQQNTKDSSLFFCKIIQKQKLKYVNEVEARIN